MDVYQLMRGVGNLCAGDANGPHCGARRMVDLLIIEVPQPS